MFRFLTAAALFAGAAFAQAPVFEASRVQVPNSADATPLAPGVLVSVYGSYLGPSQPCEGHADPDLRETPSPLRKDVGWNNVFVFPKELCGVRVLVGGEPAGLLYVHRDQINFKVPQSAPMEGTIGLQIVHRGQASEVVQIKAGLASLELSFPEPAFTNMPIWVQVKIPPNRGAYIQYPYSYWPADIGCNELEVRANGRLLEQTSPARSGGVIGGLMCGSGSFGAGYENRLPLHLLYRFEEPGDYEVRLKMMRPRFSPAGGAQQDVFIQSEWTQLRVAASAPSQRREWLEKITAYPPVAPADVTGDYLPSILGVADQQSLEAVADVLYHLDERVTQYAQYALGYWPKPQVVEALLRALERRGPSGAVAEWLLAWKSDRTDPLPVIERALPFLDSSDPVRLRGALRAVLALHLLEDNSLAPAELSATAATLLFAAERRILASGDQESQYRYAERLGHTGDQRAVPILWRFVNEGIALSPSLRSLAMIARPEDLPKLAALLFVRNMHRDYYSGISYLPQSLAEFYGEASFGYLQRVVEESDSDRLRRDAAEGLIASDHPAAWAFIAKALEADAPYKAVLMERLVSRYQEASESEAAMLALAKRLAAGSRP